jgi:hypothetical protein
VGGTKLALSRPASASWHSHAASETSVLRPGTCRACRALTNMHSNSSSRIAHGAFQYTPVASITPCVTAWPASQSRNASSPERWSKLRHVLLAPATPFGHPGARGHLRLVDVQRRRALDDHLHGSPPSGRPFHDRRPGASETNESDSRARSTLRSSGETPHAILDTGSQAPRQEDRRYGRRPNHPPLFKTPEGARQRSENSKQRSSAPVRSTRRVAPDARSDSETYGQVEVRSLRIPPHAGASDRGRRSSGTISTRAVASMRPGRS